MHSKFLLATFAALTICASGANAGKPDSPKEKTATSSQDNALAPSSMVVVKDKETGQLRAASAQEAAALRKQLRGQQIKLGKKAQQIVGEPQYGSDGMVSMVLDPSKLQLLHARTNSDGELELYHEEPEQLPEM